MKTQHYNPSPLERSFAEAIVSLKETLEERLAEVKITNVHADLNSDNPLVHFHVEDSDGDQHEIVLQVIQRIDDPS